MLHPVVIGYAERGQRGFSDVERMENFKLSLSFSWNYVTCNVLCVISYTDDFHSINWDALQSIEF